MVDEKLITKKDAVKRIPADSLAHLLAPIFDRQSASKAKKIGTGLAAGPTTTIARYPLRSTSSQSRNLSG